MEPRIESVSKNDMPEWLKKCLKCTHAYTTQYDEDELKCRCRKGCNFKEFQN